MCINKLSDETQPNFTHTVVALFIITTSKTLDVSFDVTECICWFDMIWGNYFLFQCNLHCKSGVNYISNRTNVS